MIPIFVINMRSSEKRKSDMLSNIPSSFPLTFIEATEGKKLQLIEKNNEYYFYKFNDEKILYDNKRKLDGKTLNKNQIGCAHSHLSVYKKMINENIPCACILEDDVRISNPEFVQKLFKWCNINVDKFDVIQCAKDIQWNPIIRLQKKSFEDIELFDIDRNYFNNASSYIVSLKGAMKLLNFSQPTGIIYNQTHKTKVTEVSLPADDLLSNAFVINYLSVLVPKEMPFYIDFSYKSTTSDEIEEGKHGQNNKEPKQLMEQLKKLLS